MNLISRSEAKAQGLTRYFTKEACKNGHISERFVNNGYCCICKKETRHKPEVREKERLQCIEWKKGNVEKVSQYNKDWLTINGDKRRTKRRIIYASNPDFFRSISKNWSKQNRSKVYLSNASRRATKLRATPTWVDLKAMEAFYAKSVKLSEETGITHHVDHIVPLQNEIVCGLHNQFNLQVLTATENISKGNRFWPDMPN